MKLDWGVDIGPTVARGQYEEYPFKTLKSRTHTRKFNSAPQCLQKEPISKDNELGFKHFPNEYLLSI